MQFWLGTHETSWLAKTDVPLFISHRRLAKRKSFPRARGQWALDSGGFTELGTYGRWQTSVEEYLWAVWRYSTEIGKLAWAAPMDWMCEPHMLAKTGKSVREHQELTVANYLELRDQGPFIPVLQGWELEHYHDCVELYRSAGVDLTQFEVVGIGSVCRRQHTDEILTIVSSLAERGLNLHGFGVKLQGLRQYGSQLVSSDSMAWSFDARYGDKIEGHTHKNCANCLEYALRWRSQVMGVVATLS